MERNPNDSESAAESRNFINQLSFSANPVFPREVKVGRVYILGSKIFRLKEGRVESQASIHKTSKTFVFKKIVGDILDESGKIVEEIRKVDVALLAPFNKFLREVTDAEYLAKVAKENTPLPNAGLAPAGVESAASAELAANTSEQVETQIRPVAEVVYGRQTWGKGNLDLVDFNAMPTTRKIQTIKQLLQTRDSKSERDIDHNNSPILPVVLRVSRPDGKFDVLSIYRFNPENQKFKAGLAKGQPENHSQIKGTWVDGETLFEMFAQLAPTADLSKELEPQNPPAASQEPDSDSATSAAADLKKPAETKVATPPLARTSPEAAAEKLTHLNLQIDGFNWRFEDTENLEVLDENVKSLEDVIQNMIRVSNLKKTSEGDVSVSVDFDINGNKSSFGLTSAEDGRIEGFLWGSSGFDEIEASDADDFAAQIKKLVQENFEQTD